MHALRCLALLATTAALSATTRPAAKPGNEAALAAVATPLKPSNDLGQDLLNNGVARVNSIVSKDACRELRAEVEKWLAVEDASPDDARFVPGTRLSLSTPMRLSFAGSRADLLLPIEEPVVSNVAMKAIRACLDGVEKARTLLEGTGPLEVVELGALTASIGATHQSLHSDTWGGIPNRIVLFVALDDVEDGDAGATVFADRSGDIKRSAPFSIGDVIAYDASLLHFGAQKTSGVKDRALLYCALAPAPDVETQDDLIKKSPALVAAPRVDAAALADLASFTTCTVDLSRCRIASDGRGGRGVYAARDLMRNDELARVPFDSVLGAEAAAEALGARDFAGRFRAACLLAGALAAAYVGEESCKRWRPHALSLDWGLAGERDSLRDHPVERCRRGEIEGDGLLKDTLRQLTEAAGRVSRLAPVDDDLAFRACLLVLTRAFDLSHLRDGLNSALVPVADLFNHPSSTTLPERLQSIPVSGLAVQSTRDGDDLVVRAPRGYDPRCGDELYNWYGNAGYGKTGSVEEWREAEDKFYYQYGFRMW